MPEAVGDGRGRRGLLRTQKARHPQQSFLQQVLLRSRVTRRPAPSASGTPVGDPAAAGCPPWSRGPTEIPSEVEGRQDLLRTDQDPQQLSSCFQQCLAKGTARLSQTASSNRWRNRCCGEKERDFHISASGLKGSLRFARGDLGYLLNDRQRSGA